MMTTLPLAQWLSAQRPDDAPVAWLGDHTWTLGQMRHDVATLTRHLRTQPGERWALCFEDSYLFIVALLGALHAGKTPVIPGHSRLSLLDEQRELFNGVLSDRTLGWNGPMVVVASAKHSSGAIDLPTIDPESYVEIFTSGSTGTPRRVIKPIASLDREAALLAERFAERLAGCRIVASVVPQHLYGLTFRIFLPMSLGLPLHAAMTYYAEQLVALPATYRYGFISSPAFLKRLDHTLTPPPIALIVSAGGMLPWGDVVQTQAWANVTPDEIYGSTETGILAWRYRSDDDTPWLPFTGMRFEQENDAWRAFSPLIPDPAGLLLDDNLAFEDNGLFRLHGRRGRVVKIEEKRISLCEVEQRLLALDGIVEAAALPITRNGRQGIGVLVVVDDATRARLSAAAGKQLELAWRKALIPWLEPVAIPRYWRVIDTIPVNSMNKRVYAQLQEFFHDPA
ncbi:acyl-CoA synthetase [Atlantibacter subterranea]|uniref:Acyl-CoA synthetase n=1 Tax=Atlantibacter subterraneus TaxID=255519 RepID=A0A3R9FVL9_9ENTR|nr:acyl-CoA synthetase [Atlantibacter subterranea]MDA3134550.1 acyl-CoA synthetase [Atlantibacter subterranea]RSB63713.1 acyl-CoA synthetase [Atlantibacter subterranea]RSE06602.1 acyl-CoA synthetase [Atlantibacter subterranea]RSE27905.1 acyl-CoA synthetase [Atlantibacter subterranea]